LAEILRVLPEGFILCKRFGNAEVKLWNNEIKRLLQDKVCFDKEKSKGEKMELSEIMGAKIFLPIEKVNQTEDTEPSNSERVF